MTLTRERTTRENVNATVRGTELQLSSVVKSTGQDLQVRKVVQSECVKLQPPSDKQQSLFTSMTLFAGPLQTTLRMTLDRRCATILHTCDHRDCV